ncbi:hypothetical protein M8J76_010175 [Diaphorina citri]|nr:hypothetical protein M8J76_010175 [Diaphorina citri]
MTTLDVERKLLPLHDSNGLTWYQFEHLVSCLQEDLRYAEMRFHHCVQEIRRRNEVLYCTRDTLKVLKDLTDKYADGVTKLNAYGGIIRERLVQVENVLTKLEQLDYTPSKCINKERQQMCEKMVEFNEEFLKDVKSMNEVKLVLKLLDDQMIKIYGIEHVKSGLNTMINLLSFLAKAIDHLEGETKQLMKKTNI